MKAAGISGYVGPPTGYVLRFSSGLVAYLSGDTGITAEQEKVVPGSRTETFQNAANMPAHIPLSSTTMDFGSNNTCAANC